MPTDFAPQNPEQQDKCAKKYCAGEFKNRATKITPAAQAIAQIILFTLAQIAIAEKYYIATLVIYACYIFLAWPRPHISIIVGINAALWNNFLIALIISALSTTANKINFAVPTAMLIAPPFLLLARSRNWEADKYFAIGIAALLTMGLYGYIIHGLAALQEIRDPILLVSMLWSGTKIKDKSTIKTLWISALLFAACNLIFFSIEIISRTQLWSQLSYSNILTTKGLSLDVFLSRFSGIGLYMRNGGLMLEPVNISLFFAFLFASALTIPKSASLKLSIISLSIVNTLISGGKGGILIIPLAVLLLAALNIKIIYNNFLLLIATFIIFLSLSINHLLGLASEIAPTAAPHFFAISTIADIIFSKYAILGHGFGSAGAFHSINHDVTNMSKAALRGTESGISSLLFQGGLLFFIIIYITIKKAIFNTNNTHANTKHMHHRAFYLIALPALASLWQENALSPQAAALILYLAGFTISIIKKQEVNLTSKILLAGRGNFKNLAHKQITHETI